MDEAEICVLLPNTTDIKVEDFGDVQTNVIPDEN